MKARGNFEVDIDWKNHKLIQAKIKSNIGNKCILRTSIPVQIEGTNSKQVKDGAYYINVFETRKGGVYLVHP